MNNIDPHNKSIKLWKSIATIAAIFSFVICILIVANYFQISKKDPVDVKILNTLVERLNQNPDDDALRNEIREFDLLARKPQRRHACKLGPSKTKSAKGIACLALAGKKQNRLLVLMLHSVEQFTLILGNIVVALTCRMGI